MGNLEIWCGCTRTEPSCKEGQRLFSIYKNDDEFSNLTHTEEAYRVENLSLGNYLRHSEFYRMVEGMWAHSPLTLTYKSVGLHISKGHSNFITAEVDKIRIGDCLIHQTGEFVITTYKFSTSSRTFIERCKVAYDLMFEAIPIIKLLAESDVRDT